MIAEVHRKIDREVYELMRLIRRRLTIDGKPLACDSPNGGETSFRVEVWSMASTEPTRVYQCSHLGHIEVEELDCGEIRLIGRAGTPIR